MVNKHLLFFMQRVASSAASSLVYYLADEYTYRQRRKHEHSYPKSKQRGFKKKSHFRYKEKFDNLDSQKVTKHKKEESPDNHQVHSRDRPSPRKPRGMREKLNE